MAEVTKQKVLNIKTQGAEKNVKTLKQQIKELRDQLGQLEKGTAEYDAVAQKLAQTNQKQIEVNEAMKYSNKDLGATLSNLTKVSAGVVGAISSVNSVMSLMGADSEEAVEAMKRIQSLMAIIQGLGAIDTAIKALKGLTVAFKDFNTVKGASAVVTAGATTAELAEAGALAENTVKMHHNNEEAKEYNRLNQEGTEATKESREEIDKETTAIMAKTEAQRGNIEAAEKYKKELEKLNQVQKETQATAQNEGYSIALKYYQEQMNGLEKDMQAYQRMINTMTEKGAGDYIERDKKRLAELEKMYIKNAASFNRMVATGETQLEDLTAAFKAQLVNINDSTHKSFDSVEDSIDQCNRLIAGMPFEQAQRNAEYLADTMEHIVKNAQLGLDYAKNTEDYETQKQYLGDMIELQQYQQRTTQATIVQMQQRQVQQAELKQKIIETTDAETAETNALNGNTAAKKANAEATGDVADEEKKLTKETQKSDPILRKAWSGITNGIKNAGKAIKAFVVGNPIFAIILAAVTAIAAGIGIWARQYAKAREKAAELQKMNNEIEMSFRKEKTDMEALLRMFYAQNTTQKEKETLAKEINKLAKEELVTRNEVTGQWELSNTKLLEYNKSLRTSIELEYHKKAILESMDKEEEARNNAIHERNHLIGSLFSTENGYLEDANEEVAKQEEHWKAIEKLTAGTVKNIERENKATKDTKTTAGGVKKTFQEMYKEMLELYKRIYNQMTSAKELRKVFNGVYSEASVAFDKMLDAINANNAAKKVSKEFKEALKNQLNGIKSTEITLDFMFGENFTKLDKQINEAKDKLKTLLNTRNFDEKQLTVQKAYVDNLEKELKTMTDIANATVKYQQAVESAKMAEKERTDSVKQYNKEQEINQKFIAKQRRENGKDFQYAELEKEIELNKLLKKVTEERLTEERNRINELRQSNIQNEATIKEIADLQKKIDEDQKTANEAQLNINNAYWQKRLTKLDEVYAKIQRNSEVEQQNLEIERNRKGGGVADYNTEVDLIEMQMQAMTEYADYIDDFYEKRKAKYTQDSQEWLLLEQERLAAQEALQDEYRAKELEADKAQAERKLAIQQAYINTYQSLSGQLSSILGEAMNAYDENSREYLNLRYAQGVTDTISGTLSAYMSGIQSGLPAPANAILAGIMAASTFAVGVMQLTNMRNGTLANAAASPVQIGSQYDTLTYKVGVDTLSAIQDQRVWVSIHDIQDTGRRVDVIESQSVF